MGTDSAQVDAAERNADLEAFGMALMADVSSALREVGIGHIADRIDQVALIKVKASVHNHLAAQVQA